MTIFFLEYIKSFVDLLCMQKYTRKSRKIEHFIPVQNNNLHYRLSLLIHFNSYYINIIHNS